MKIVFKLTLVLLVTAMVLAAAITRDAKLVTPAGSGSVVLDAGTFEAFPLPDYAAKHV